MIWKCFHRNKNFFTFTAIFENLVSEAGVILKIRQSSINKFFLCTSGHTKSSTVLTIPLCNYYYPKKLFDTLRRKSNVFFLIFSFRFSKHASMYFWIFPLLLLQFVAGHIIMYAFPCCNSFVALHLNFVSAEVD